MDNKQKTYTYDEKVALSEKIRKLDNKNNIINILKIIYEDNQNIFENKNGIYMFFHLLGDSTYAKIEYTLKLINNNVKSTGEKKEYIPYVKDEFPSQKELCPKLKFSNKERNLIKRCRYDESINLDNETNIVYQEFDVTSDSEKKNV